MATFMENLAANPSGGIYGQPSGAPDVMGMVNQLKDRELRDFKDKATFMSDLSERQQLRMRNLLGPDQQGGQGDQPNTVMAQDPNQLTGYQKGELSIRQGDQNLESQKLQQQGKLGQEAADTRAAQEKLNQQKSDQINQLKISELQQKADKAVADLKLSNDKLQANVNDHEAHIKFLTDKQAADEARKALEDAQREAVHQENKRKDDATIANLQDQIKKRGQPSTTTSTIQGDPNAPTGKTVTTVKGATGTVTVTGKDGNQYQIPADKVDDWNSNHAPDDSSQ